MKKRIFCLLLVVAMMASLGMTVFAESETVAPPQETAATTETTLPAETVPEAEVPAEPEAPAEPAEVPAEPAPIPEGEPAADVPAAGEEVPGVEEAPAQDAAPAPNDEPAVISEPAPAPISIPTLAASPNSISTQNAYASWLAYVRGEDWKSVQDGHIALTLTGADEAANIQWFVSTDKGGVSAGHNGDGDPATTCVTVAEDKTLYLIGGSNLAGCADGFTCTITAYAMVGVAKSNEVKVTFKSEVEPPKPTATPAPEGEIPDKMLDKSDTKDDYTKGVWLHVVNGNFENTNKYPDAKGKASVWVEFEGEGTRTLPNDLPQVTATNGTFHGWFTKAGTEEMVTSEDGTYCYRKSTYSGEQVLPGGTVPEGITVLYATFEYTEPKSEDTQFIQYYLDYNGMMGMYGHCLEKTTLKKGAKFTAKDAAVYNFNFTDNVNAEGHFAGDVTWENLADYWAKTTFKDTVVEQDPTTGVNHTKVVTYTFLGWSTEAKDGQIISSDTEIKNGMSFYARWTSNESSSEKFEPPVEKTEPLSHLRFLNLRYSAHGEVGTAVTVSPYASPQGAKMEDVEWTITYGTPNTKYTQAPPVTFTETVKEGEPFDGKNANYDKDGNFGPDAGFKAEAKDGTLIITNQDGQEHTVTVRVSAHPVDAEGNKLDTVISSPADAPATVSFVHNYAKMANGEHKDATCLEHGYDTYECTTCGATTQKIIPTLNHTWKLEVTQPATCTVDGVKQDQCTVCHMTFDEYQQWLKDRDKPVVNPQHPTEVVPATGHSFKLMSTASSAVPGAPLLKEECQVCHEEETVLCGDVNDDGGVNIVDLYAIYSYVLGETSSMTKTLAGDVNVDGTTNIVDLYRVYGYVLGEIPSL